VAAFAVLGRGIAAPSGAPPILRKQCGLGIVPVEVAREGEAREYIMTQGPSEYRGTDIDAAAGVRMLGCGAADILDHPFEVVSTGVPWLMAVLRDREVLAALEPDPGSIKEVCPGLEAIGISPISLNAFADGCSVKVRAFAPGQVCRKNR
jgi:predicted PhzF superfamily epimerase YddE/YHI9